MRGAQTNEQMHMVGNAADGLWNAVEAMDDAAEKGMQSLAIRGGDDRAAILGGKDEMVVERKMGGWHRARVSQRPCRGGCIFSHRSGGLRHRLISEVPAGRKVVRGFSPSSV